MIAQELEVSLHMAFVEARQKRHEFITVEHLLLALIDNPSAAEALRACGAKPETLRQDLTGFVNEHTPTVNGDDDGNVYYGGPMSVMIDRYSASASEIFAAAMQDYGRALILGENSFGKGTVQQHRSLAKVYDFYEQPLGHVQYTIAKFYRIDGGSTQNKGVAPDIAFPTAVAPGETGESREFNALPWDKIASASYERLGDFSSLLPKLKAAHEARITKDPEFAYVLQDIKEYQADKDKKSVSLNEAERLAEQAKQDEKALARANERLTRLGKPTVKSLDELPTDFEAPDEYQVEAANITADLATLSKNS
jgi:carboxyl-terminal processing protease